MAGRPVKRRTTQTYERDIESITRLRSALALDQSQPWELRKAAMNACDAFLETLIPLIPASESINAIRAAMEAKITD